MATATKGKNKADECLIQFPLKCGSVSIGDKKVSVPIKISRDNCTLGRADKFLVKRRLTAVLRRGAVPAGDAAGQAKLDGMGDTDTEVLASFDTSNISVGDKTIGLTISANIKEVAGKLDVFAKQEGSLLIKSVDKVSADELDGEDGDEDEDEEDAE